MKSSPSLRTFSLLAGIALAGCASDGVRPATLAATPAPDPTCITQTGSYLKSDAAGYCLPVNGRSYTREELQRTSGMTLGEKLNNLVLPR